MHQNIYTKSSFYLFIYLFIFYCYSNECYQQGIRFSLYINMLCPAQKHTSSFLLLIYRIDQISKRLNLIRLQGRTEAIRYSSPDTLLLHRVLVHINIEFYKSQAIESNCTGYAIMVNEKVRTRVNNNIYNTYSKYF